MKTEFLSDNFLLDTKTAEKLYHDHAAKMPIYDYHCHLAASVIADDSSWDNLTQIGTRGTKTDSYNSPTYTNRNSDYKEAFY